MPTLLIREFPPCVTAIVNSSLSQGRLPDSHKLPIVITTSQEARSWHSRHGEFSTSLECIIPVQSGWASYEIRQLNDHINKNGLFHRYQSAFRRHHSTETATTSPVRRTDRRWCRQMTLLALLDMSAAFDCVDHDLLLGETLPTQGWCTKMDEIIPYEPDAANRIYNGMSSAVRYHGLLLCTAS